MTKNNPDERTTETYVNNLHDDLVAAPPESRLDDVHGLDEVVEKARRVLIEPHRNGQTAAAAKTAIINTRPDRGTTRLPNAIAGELADAGFQFARLDVDSSAHADVYSRPRDFLGCIDALVEEQPFVLIIDRIQIFRAGGLNTVSQRLTELADSDHRVVIIGIDNSTDSRPHNTPGLEQIVDLTLTIPKPKAGRREHILKETLEDVARECDIERSDSLDVGSYASQLDGYEPHWVTQVAQRAVTLAASDEEPVTDEQMTTAIAQVKEERPEDSDGPFGQATDTSAEFEATVPEASFDDVGGLDDTIEHLNTVVDIQQSHADVYEEAGFSTTHGMLLAGPPGTGKTLLARAVANELDRTFLSVKGPQLKHPMYGMSERRIRQLFETADEEAPSVIFFDEFDAIAGDRSSFRNEVNMSLVATLLTELDGIEDQEDLLVLAATNRKEAIDEAFLRQGRLGEVVEVPVPDTEAQTDIFDIHTESLPTATDVTGSWFVSEAPDHLTGADIEGICKNAFRNAVAATSGEDVEVTRADIQEAMTGIQTGTSREQARYVD